MLRRAMTEPSHNNDDVRLHNQQFPQLYTIAACFDSLLKRESFRAAIESVGDCLVLVDRRIEA